ncbi:unnamed protein product [Psylliodes chrysocephalus]|uniref:Uncharacterized protein n=1 Tax=Psylliodes chrysocephalus TaxID=3402493 RepID=A0A9P0DDR7_9CUCU|nr:unnamed protein product [Psylliodes chrysocephala]
MKFNLKCNTNCHDHIDYRFPITPNQVDFRTTSHISHDYFHPISQDWERQIKTKPKLDLLQTHIRTKDEKIPLYKRDYSFKPKQEDALVKYEMGHQVTDKRYFQECRSKGPPPSVPIRSSEMKESFGFPPWTPATRELLPPDITARCEITCVANSLQPAIPPQKPGYTKLLDNYMSQNSLDFRPYDEVDFVRSRRDLPTRYNIIGTYPKSKYLLGGNLTGNKEVFDKQVMKPQYPNKNISRGWQRVPHRGMQSEYGGSYTTQTFSDVYPYLYDNGVIFPSPTEGDCGPWQIYAIPAMYCTDYCHIGSGYPIRSVLNCITKDRKYPHTPADPCVYCGD